MESGFYTRIERDGKWKTVDLTEMTFAEINQFFIDRPTEELIKWIFALTKAIGDIEEYEE